MQMFSQMSRRDYNTGNTNQGMPSDWNSQDGPDIGVWEPVPTSTNANADTSRQGNSNTYGSSMYDYSSQSMQPQAQRQHQASGSINSSDWRSQTPTGTNMPSATYESYYGQQYTVPDPSLGGFCQQQLTGMNNAPLQNVSNSFGQYGAEDLSNMPGNYSPAPQYYPGQYTDNLHTCSNGSMKMPGNSNFVSQPQSLSMTIPNSDRNERVVTQNTYSPGSFRNPLLDSSTDTADILENLKIGSQQSERLLANKPAVPSHFPQSSLIMIQKHLIKAAEPFSSPEAYKLARERELGFHSNPVIVSNLSAHAANFVPRSRSPAGLTREIKAANEEEEAAVLSSLTKLIDTVLLQPGNFDNLSAVFINQVCRHTHADGTVEEMVDMIFCKAIKEDNFKYLGARLCDRLTTPDVLNNFRSNFLNRLQKEFKKIDEFFDTAMDENIAKIHGFITFMAEVFIHIKINGNPIRALGKAFGRFLSKLLSKPDENTSFVCKMMKLAGSKLCDALSFNEDDIKIYEEVFRILKEYSDQQKNGDDEKTKRLLLLITSVLRLKDSNWGRTMSNSRKKSSIADPEEYGDQLSENDQNYYMNEPVFFTPDGTPYTAAEAQIPEFYDEHLAKFNVAQNNSNEENLAFPWSSKDRYFDEFVPSEEEEEFCKEDDGEYDDEFEKFLAESGQLP